MENKQIKVGAILSYVVIALDIIIGIAYTPFLTKMLGQSEYGLYSLVASIISYITVLDLGFGNAIIIYTARYRVNGKTEEENKLHGMFFIIYIIIGIIATFVGVILCFNINKLFSDTTSMSELEIAKKLMIILTLNLGITFSFTIFNDIIIAYEKFIFNKAVKMLRIVLLPMLMIPLLLLGYKSVALVIVTTLVNVLIVIINTTYCFKKLKIKLNLKGFNLKLLKEIFTYSFFIFLNIIIDKINWSADQLILGKIVGTSAVAVYAIASQLNTAYISFATAISSVLLPKVTKMEEKKANDREFTEIFIKTGRIQFIIMGLIITGFLIFGRKFINLWVGPEYADSYIITCLLIIPITIDLIQNIGLSILQAKNLYKYATMVIFIITIFNIIISIPLAKLYGGIGAAVGTAIALILGKGIVLNILYKKLAHIDILKFWQEILKMSIPVMCTFIIGIILTRVWMSQKIITFILQITIYSMIYIGFMWKFGINEYEKKLMKGIMNKFIKIENEK